MLRYTVCEAIFEILLKNYIDSLSMKVSEEGRDVWYVGEHQVGIENDKLVCACAYYDRTGIPCKHQIRAIVELHEDIMNYIDKRWLLKL